MITLGIESSCDETAVALVHDSVMIKQSLFSQARIHALFGGVVPEVASREHYHAISSCFNMLFENSSYTIQDLDCIAVARGPGLLGSLLVGIAFAKGLSFQLQKPLIGVNHLHAHLMAVGLESPLSFPFIGVLLSGGHTYTYYCSSYTECIILGRTLDDAVGELFDKVGKMLGMEYPSGKYIEEYAYRATEAQNIFTLPYCKDSNTNYSFSGLKTQVLHYIRTHPECILKHYTQEDNIHCAVLCASLVKTVTETILHKVENAIVHCIGQGLPYQALVLGGGVASNSFIRNGLQALAIRYQCDFFVPHHTLCTDNAYMIAYLGEQLHTHGYYHTTALSAIPRGNIVPIDYSSL